MVLLGIAVFSLAGCATMPGPMKPAPTGYTLQTRPGPEGPALHRFPGEPQVRVRVQRSAQSITLNSGSELNAQAGSNSRPVRMRPPVTVTRNAQGFLTQDGAGNRLQWATQDLRFTTGTAEPLRIGENPYPGTATLYAANAGPRFDVINTLPMEQYLPGVLERELYDSWDPAAYRAQAVAARSYALWELDRARQKRKAWDLESTVASQAYVGVATNPKTTDAVRATRGIVLVYRGRVVPAFYSSAVGPAGADGAQVFPDRAPDIMPLRGRNHGGWDQQSPRYHWAASRTTDDLARRLAAWGRDKGHPVASIRGPVAAIQISLRNRVGRHAAYTVTDAAGQRFSLRADDLRHAANTAAPGLPKPGKDQNVFSGQFVPLITGNVVQFTRGQGYGHGVGMSQFGAQAMAQAGHNHPAILGFYYPGAALHRLY